MPEGEMLNPPRRLWCPHCGAITVQDVVAETRDTDRCVCRLCHQVTFLPADAIAGFRPTQRPTDILPNFRS